MNAKTDASRQDQVLALFRLHPEGLTYKQVIAGLTEDVQDCRPEEGNALAAPIIRMLSDLSHAGILSSSETVVNDDTGRLNTLYRLDTGAGAQPRLTAKEKLAALEAQLKACRQELVACRYELRQAREYQQELLAQLKAVTN